MAILALGIVAAASLVIWKACDYFEAGSAYVGKGMPPGVRGATINAIGSSLPELLTTFCLLFLFRDQDGFSAGIATCAGSAVFNAVIIPALVILVVVWKEKIVPHIVLDRPTVIRDGVFFIGAELLLIYFLSDHTLKWWMGLALMGVYVAYFSYMMMQIHGHTPDEDDEDEAEEEMTTSRAWRYLGVSTAVIACACYGLSWSVIELAEAWGVPAFMTAVVFGAAATSVPDTVLSLKDAMKGDYDDAVANAIGSNIFDITICLGLPLFCYGLVYGDVSLSAVGSEANVQVLRIGLVVVSSLVLALFLLNRQLKTWSGVALLSLFGGWLGFLALMGA